MLPPGQKKRTDFPRFGLPPYADRFPDQTESHAIVIQIDDGEQITIQQALADLPATSVCADFHCVTTWTYCDALWGGVRFKDFFERHVSAGNAKATNIMGAVFHAQDGYKTTLLKDDFLNDTVLIASTLNHQPLSIEHGAPLRLVAPEHYGYKNLKHLKRIEFHTTLPVIKRGFRSFLDHPRARVSHEERGKWIPGWILRYVYRPLVNSTVKEFHEAMVKKKEAKD